MGDGCHLHESYKYKPMCHYVCNLFRIMKLFALFAFILFVEFGSCEDVQYFSTVGDFISDYSESGSNVLDYVTLENDPKSNLPEENIKKFNVYPFACICKYLLYVHIISLSTLSCVHFFTADL